MAVQIFKPNVCCCITWGNRTSATWDKKEKSISEFNHYRYVTALITVYSTAFAGICSSKFMGRCLKI